MHLEMLTGTTSLKTSETKQLSYKEKRENGLDAPLYTGKFPSLVESIYEATSPLLCVNHAKCTSKRLMNGIL